ncbi:MAG: HEPN domain-containing protein [Gammaproteobacteria bacterium]|nr:HEPN domain-containing protein [Gammaproteobacteria bacterium]
MTTTFENSDRKGWISRFGKALEDTAGTARPSGVDLRTPGLMDEDLYQREQHRRYREMGELARTDPYAAKLFDESHLWLDGLPDGVLNLLLQHPVFEHAWSRGSREAFHFVRILGGGHADVESLIANLAKLSVKVGGKRAATMLHRFLVAGEGVRLHAHEITVLHGLKLEEPIPLGRGAYLASYDAARKRFELPEDPELWLKRSEEGLDSHPGRLAHASSRAVLVRPVRWGPAVAPCNCPTNSERLKLRYRFPDDHCVELIADVFEERETLLNLLSIAVRSKLVSHTVINAVPRWMTQLDPNLRTGSPGGGRGIFDVWPKDQAPSVRDLVEFVMAARGWLTFCAGTEDRSTELAVRRTAASFGIPGGRFGVEDRLLDASIALEAMYGPFDSEITRKISSRAAWLLGDSAAERRAISKDMKSFYTTRSKVVHGTASEDRQKRGRELDSALKSGRQLARRTLFRLLARGPVNDESEWDTLMRHDPTVASDR